VAVSLPPPQPNPLPPPSPAQPFSAPPASPPAAAAPPAAGSSKKGCGTGLIVLAVVLVVLFVGGMATVAVGAHWLGKKVENGLVGTPCPYLSNAEAEALFGSGATAQSLNGFLGGSMKVVLDTRVLGDVTGCVVYSGESAAVRVARTDGGHARYVQERKLADTQTQDRGNGLSVERESYVLHDLEGVGDEGFCTTLLGDGQSGALVRKGDVLVYVSVTNASLDAEQGCQQAQKAALAVAGS
jgi:hypothetical protein